MTTGTAVSSTVGELVVGTGISVTVGGGISVGMIVSLDGGVTSGCRDEEISVSMTVGSASSSAAQESKRVDKRIRIQIL